MFLLRARNDTAPPKHEISHSKHRAAMGSVGQTRHHLQGYSGRLMYQGGLNKYHMFYIPFFVQL